MSNGPDSGIFEMLDELEEAISAWRDNEWVRKFLADMKRRRENDKSFTPNQRLKIVDLWEQYVP